MTIDMHRTRRASQSGMVAARQWCPKICVGILHEVLAVKCKAPALEDQKELGQWAADGSETLLPFVEAVSISALCA